MSVIIGAYYSTGIKGYHLDIFFWIEKIFHTLTMNLHQLPETIQSCQTSYGCGPNIQCIHPSNQSLCTCTNGWENDIILLQQHDCRKSTLGFQLWVIFHTFMWLVALIFVTLEIRRQPNARTRTWRVLHSLFCLAFCGFMECVLYLIFNRATFTILVFHALQFNLIAAVTTETAIVTDSILRGIIGIQQNTLVEPTLAFRGVFVMVCITTTFMIIGGYFAHTRELFNLILVIMYILLSIIFTVLAVLIVKIFSSVIYECEDKSSGGHAEKIKIYIKRLQLARIVTIQIGLSNVGYALYFTITWFMMGGVPYYWTLLLMGFLFGNIVCFVCLRLWALFPEGNKVEAVVVSGNTG